MADSALTQTYTYVGKPVHTGQAVPVSTAAGDYIDPLVYAAARRDPPYIPSADLVDAVNLSIAIERPLLLKGEPGSGKTRLAKAVAAELGLPFEAWYIKSTSKVRDGLYSFDALRRLRDAQLAAVFSKDFSRARKVDDIQNYIHLEQLGRAITSAKRTVVLIDEIDKADIDFPNDLLLELDEHRFQIPEMNTTLPETPCPTPIVFITSNDEKDLPDAFLRRCVFFYIDFPSKEVLTSIAAAHLAPPPGDPQANVRQEIITAAVDRFWEERTKMDEEKKPGKKISTSELLDWTRALLKNLVPPARIRSKEELVYPWLLLKDTEELKKAPRLPRAGISPA